MPNKPVPLCVSRAGCRKPDSCIDAERCLLPTIPEAVPLASAQWNPDPYVAMALLKGIIRHWNEFGAADGLDEMMHYAHEYLEGRGGRHETSPPETSAWRSMDGYVPTVEPPTFVLIAEQKPDGSYVVGEARYFGEQGWRWAGNDPTDHWGREVYPIYWMPLPDPPASPVKTGASQT